MTTEFFSLFVVLINHCEVLYVPTRGVCCAYPAQTSFTVHGATQPLMLYVRVAYARHWEELMPVFIPLYHFAKMKLLYSFLGSVSLSTYNKAAFFQLLFYKACFQWQRLSLCSFCVVLLKTI